METLRRKPFVRESEVFSALFPRGPTPKSGDALPSIVAPKGARDEATDRESTDVEKEARRIPKLGALSPKTPRTLMATLPMTASDCAVVWKYLCDWIKAQVAMEAPATIPGFGTVSMRTQALKIRIPFFEPDRGFLDKHGLRVDTPSGTTHGALARTGSSSDVSSLRPQALSSAGVDVYTFNFVEMAACCGRHVEVNKAKEWLSTLLLRLGEALRQCERVEFDLGVGVVACVDRVLEVHMLPRYTSSTPQVPFEIRGSESTVMRALRISSSPKTSRHASFLSSSNFSKAIHVHAARERESGNNSELFAFDPHGSLQQCHSEPARSLTAVLPTPSNGAFGPSPRTRRLRNHVADQLVEPSKKTNHESLFDSLSRTFCVEPDLNLSFLQPSNRIASNYAPVAASLVMVKHTYRLTGSGRGSSVSVAFSTETLPCDPPYPEETIHYNSPGSLREDESIDAARRREVSEGRYFAYLSESNQLMDTRWLAPLDEILVERIVASAVKYLSSPPSGHMKTVLDAARDEFIRNYHISVKKAIMDYLLLRSATRERLGIVCGTPAHTALPSRWQWGNNKGLNGCMNDLRALTTKYPSRAERPISQRILNAVNARRVETEDSNKILKKRRRKRVKLKLASTFMLADPQIRVLQYMWYDFESILLLVKLPDLEELSARLEPLDLRTFEDEQLSHASYVKGYLIENWYQRARVLFENAVIKTQGGPYSSVESSHLRHLFNAVAVQMSLQVRSLIFKSIRAYVAFFELFAQPSEGSNHLGCFHADSNKPYHCPSALLVSLSLLDRDIQFETPLIEIPSMLLSVVHNLIQLFHNVNRIETQFAKSLEPLFTTSIAGTRDSDSYSPFLWNVSVHEEEIADATMRIRDIIEKNLAQLYQLQTEYSTYGTVYRQISFVCSDDDTTEMDRSFSSEKTASWREELHHVRNVACTLQKIARSVHHLNLFSVHCAGVNDSLLAAFSLWVHRQLSRFAEATAASNAHLRQQYKDVAARLAKRPLDLYELVDAEAFVEVLKTSKLKELQAMVEDLKQRMQFLLFHSENVHAIGSANHGEETGSRLEMSSIPGDLLASAAKTIRWRSHIERLLEEAESLLVGERARIEAVFLAKRNRFQAEIDEFDIEVKGFSKKGDLRHAATYVVQLTKMKEALFSFRRQMESIMEEELKLQWKTSDFGKLDDIAEEMEPYEQLWKTAREFRELNSRWLRTNVFELQSHEGLQALQAMIETISAVSNQLHLNSAAAAITAELLKKQMGDFRENAKLVSAILNPAVQERHLKEMSALVGLTIDPVELVTLLKLLENGAYDHLPRIAEISEDATMEKQVEDALRGIYNEWQGVQLHFKLANVSFGYSTKSNEDSVTQALLISSVSDIKLLIEDHQLRLQTLQCLPHAVPFSIHIQQWVSFLHDLVEILDLLVINERLWKRVLPLFAAGIVDDNAEEAAIFAQADLLHRSTVNWVENQPLCLELVKSITHDFRTAKIDASDVFEGEETDSPRHHLLLADLRQCRQLLENAGYNISLGFEARRSHFPRFYFLSDNELVSALASQSPNVAGPCSGSTESCGIASPQFWRYMRLCFPGIHRIHTKASSPHAELTSFISAHDEQVPISSPIPTANVPLEVWLTKLETAMGTILQACIRAAISDFARKEFRKWCLLWPEQVLVATIYHTWTIQGEISNRKASVAEARKAWQVDAQTLAERADAVGRELKAAASPGVRLTLSNVILLLNQLRDVSARVAAEISSLEQSRQFVLHEDVSCVETPNPAFEAGQFETTSWLSQPRLYYNANSALGVKVMSFTAIPYGFEYWGNTSPSVCIMPLTLRCYHSLALHVGMLNRGSHVRGPSGSGKRTACTALARMCGRLMVLFDCQDYVSTSQTQKFNALGRFIKGAVSSGAWLMLSGIHQLQPVEASLLGSVCSHILDCNASKLTQCVVFGVKLKLKKGLHLITTSSSSDVIYQPKLQVIHERLRSAFRPIEVQVHDLAVISEFFLRQFQMVHASDLAKVVNAVNQIIQRQSELIVGDGSMATKVGECIVKVQNILGIAMRAAELCAQERPKVYSAHGWPPQAPHAQAVSGISNPLLHFDVEMPADLARDIEKMETKATCIALRESAGSLVPARSLEMIDFVLRDFSLVSLNRELRVSKSFLATAGVRHSHNSAGLVETVLAQRKQVNHDSVEDMIVRILDETVTDPSTESAPCQTLSSKAIQLYQSLVHHRVVVVVGDVQSGKTALWCAVARTMTKMSDDVSTSGSDVKRCEIVNKTRCVVIHPRAVTLEQLFSRSESVTTGSLSNCLVGLIARDAKHEANDHSTWLVLDGDVDEVWAWQVLQSGEYPAAPHGMFGASEYPGTSAMSRLPGLLVPDCSKRLTLHPEMRVLIETTVLEHVSPSFITKVGVINANGCLTDFDLKGDPSKPPRFNWRLPYRKWKTDHETAFVALREELFNLLDTLLDETMDACLDFVAEEFLEEKRIHRFTRGVSRFVLIQWRLGAFLALLYCLLIQSWPKIASMVSGKQRKTAVHCYFLQALVWGIGYTSETIERLKFNTFLRQWIIAGPRSADSSLKRVLVLFFPSGTMGSAAAGLSGMGATHRRLDVTGGSSSSTVTKDTLYNFGFSVELGSKWMRWAEFYDTWLADRFQYGSDGLTTAMSGFSNYPGSPSNTLSVDSISGGRYPREGRSNQLFVRTPAMAAAVYLLYQLMSNRYPVLLSGSRDSGKTTCGRVWMELHALVAGMQSKATISGPSSSGESNDDPVRSEHVYMGQSVTSHDVLEQLEAFIEQRRIQQRRVSAQDSSFELKRSRPNNLIASSTLVFVDDLQCCPKAKSNSSVVELFRGILEHKQLVHPSANTLMDCSDALSLFAALRHDGSRSTERELVRVLTRMMPIGLPPLSDVDLSSICSAYVTSRTNSDLVVDQGSSDFTFSAAAQEASQLLASLIKATIRLFRVLSSDQWCVQHTPQIARSYAATTAFNPSKAHYLFHVQDVLRVLHSVYCDAMQTMSLSEKIQIAKLWSHESARVFGDRLNEESDVAVFYNLLQDTVVTHFNIAPDGLLPEATQLDFASSGSSSSNTKNLAQVTWLRDHLHFSFIGESSGAGMTDGYREVHELQKVELSIERTMMAMYRANVVTESLPFVLCNHAIRHILRLTRVLRNSDDRHVLLIGRSGCKMRTLTRLAAFVCHKATTSFFTSRDGDDTTRWKAALKSALICSLCQPGDERMVIIVKDTWLANLEIYATIDRYFSGSKLLSDVVSYGDFDDTILQALRKEAGRERREGATLPPKTHNQMTLMHSKSSVLEYFFELVRRKLQFVIIISLPPDRKGEDQVSCPPASQRFAELIWRYPFIQRNCTIDYFFDWPEESLHVIAQKCFSGIYGSERDRLMQLSQVAVQMYLRTRTVWPVWARGGSIYKDTHVRPRTSDGGEHPDESRTKSAQQCLALPDRPSAFIQLDPSILVEQISLFVTYFPRLQRELEANKAKFAGGLDFIERTEQILALEQSQQQLLQPEMAQKTAATRRMSGNLEKEKLASTKVSRALQVETAQVDTQRARLAQVEAEYNELIGQTRELFEQRAAEMRPFSVAMLEQSQSSVMPAENVGSSVDDPTMEEQKEASVDQDGVVARARQEVAARRHRRAMIRTFVSILHPSTSLRQLAECLGLIFGIEPVEARDELDPDEIVMDYWGTTTKRMETPGFWQELAEFDVRARMSEKIVARVLPICTGPDFEPELFRGVHELAMLLCAWVQACTSFAKDSVLAEPKYAQLRQERLAYNASIAQMRARQVELNVQTTSMSNANAMRTLSEQERKQLEEKLKDSASTLQMTASVWKVLQPSKAKWKQLYEHCTEFAVQAMGDLMLTTAAMAYASSTTRSVRQRLRALWSEVLNKHYVVHSPTEHPRSMDQVFLVDECTLTRWQIDGLPTQEYSCVESAVTTLRSFLFPVLIDPHRIATNWLRRQCGELGISDTDDTERKMAKVISAKTSTREIIWEMIVQSTRKKRPLVVEDFDEPTSCELYSFLQSKRRARFDYVNRDISSVGVRDSVDSSSAGSSVSIRRTSSISIGLGSTSREVARLDSAGFSVFDSHRCWFDIPASTSDEKLLFECTSESCRVYFVFSESESVPEWMNPLASCIALVRFDFSPAHVQTTCLRTILGASEGHNHVMTEIESLQVDTISCNEQIEIIENEMLDFFSTEDPVVVYGDTAKALKIVGNRSARNTLENSKIEAIRRIRYHYLRLASYSSLVRRSVDIVRIWRDVAGLEASLSGTDVMCPIHWVWTSLLQALKAQGIPDGSATDSQVSLFTTLVRQYVKASVANERFHVIFDLILSLKVGSRRCLAVPSLEDELSGNSSRSEIERTEIIGEDPQQVDSVFPRLIQLLDCEDDAQLRTLCAGVSSKLLSLRPSDMIPAHKWRVLCYLAERLPSLRDLIIAQQDHGGKDRWVQAMDLETLVTRNRESWSPKTSLDALTRLCFVAVLRKDMFFHEVEVVIAQELAWTCLTKPPLLIDTSEPIEDSVELQEPPTEAKPELGNNDVSQFRPLQLVDLWKIYSDMCTPIVVGCRPEVDFVRDVAEVAARVKATVDLTTQESRTDQAFKESLIAAIRKGHWVVIAHLDSHPSWHSIITHLLLSIHNHEPHSDFRLWVSTFGSVNRIISSGLQTICYVNRSPFSFADEFRRALAIVCDQYSTRSTDPGAIPLCGTVLRVRLCVLHALVTCRHHISCDLEIYCGVRIGDDAFLDCLCEISQAEQHCSSEEELWNDIRSLVNKTYEPALRTLNMHLIFRCCAELVFERPRGTDSLLLDSASRTIPDIGQLLRVLDELESHRDVTAVGYIQQIWMHVGSNFDASLTDFKSQHARSTLRDLRRILENRALLSVAPAKPNMTQPATPSRGGRVGTPPTSGTSALRQSATLVVDSLSRFVLDLEGYEFDEIIINEKFPLEYKQPLNQVFHHEIDLLRRRHRSLISRIRHLQQVSTASEATNPSVCADIEAITRDETPRAWADLAPICCNNQRRTHTILPLEKFQLATMDQLRFFQSWLDTGSTSRLCVDKFQSPIHSLFEAIHQHFVRNLVGTTHCNGAKHCLYVLRILEDKPQTALSARDGSVYVAGLRLYGHLQMDITGAHSNLTSYTPISTFEQRKKPQSPPKTPQNVVGEVRREGTPVILEISSLCLTTTNPSDVPSNLVGSSRGFGTVGGSSSSNTSSRRSSLASSYNFWCPIVIPSQCVQVSAEQPSLAALNTDHDLGIVITSSLPVHQLVFSCSHLRLASAADVPD